MHSEGYIFFSLQYLVYLRRVRGFIFTETHESRICSVAKGSLNLPETENKKKRTLIVGIQIITGIMKRCVRTMVANSFADKEKGPTVRVFFPNSHVTFARVRQTRLNLTYTCLYIL